MARAGWVGGFVSVVVVARVARRELEPPTRVAFFRTFGHTYGMVAGPALGAAVASGVALLAGRGWEGLAVSVAGMAGALLVITAAGVVQARGMTRLRQRAVDEPTDAALAERIRRGAVRAAVLRGAIGVLTLALVALGVALAT